jgi:predicted flap endonuclease-1-like 5' DNA nuclease
MASIIKIEGIGPVYQQKLQSVGVKTVEKLLKIGATSAGRDKLAKDADISRDLILEWVNHADLWRIKGVGVDTVKELAQRRADNLFARMNEVNMSKKLVRRLPTESQVADWINQAKKLPGVVTY